MEQKGNPKITNCSFKLLYVIGVFVSSVEINIPPLLESQTCIQLVKDDLLNNITLHCEKNNTTNL